MKVNTDAVVLGALVCREWPELLGQKKYNDPRILDIGTGSGILALMLAQVADAKIAGVEMDADSCHQAEQNFKSSPWAGKLEAMNLSFQDFYIKQPAESFQLIISNPPYFESPLPGNNPVQPNPIRALARFEDSLPFHTLLSGTVKLLHPEGFFYVILPAQRAIEFTGQAVAEGLYLQRQTDIISKSEKPVSRVVLRFGKLKERFVQTTLILHDAQGKRTNEFLELTQDFYL